MAASATIQVTGLRELGERMRKLSDKVAKRVSVAATGAAARVIKKRAIANVVRNPSIETGSLRDSLITKKVPKGQSAVTSEHIVTVRGRGKPANKKGQKINRAPHAHLVEFGTVNMPAEPFLRPAFDNGKKEALDAMVDRLTAGITRNGA